MRLRTGESRSLVIPNLELERHLQEALSELLLMRVVESADKDFAAAGNSS